MQSQTKLKDWLRRMGSLTAMTLPIAAGVLFCGYASLLFAQEPPTELKDWQTSLRRFIDHVDSVPKSPPEPSKPCPNQPQASSLNPPLDQHNLVYLKTMTTNGDCDEDADNVFGPLVQFEGNFTRISDQQGHEYQVVMSYAETSPGSIISVSATEADLASWRRLSPGAQVRFQAELTCLTRMESPDGKVMGYYLTLRRAKVLLP
jgi:hypothetical protein